MTAAADAPALVPRTEPLDVAALGLAEHCPHPRPFALDLSITTAGMSRAVEHVSNIEYVRWLDRAAELHSDALGYTRQRMLADDVMWFVGRHEIDYLAEVVPGDELLILTWVRDMVRVRSWRDYVILRATDGVPVCRAATLWVFVRLSNRRPLRVPAEMIAAFDPLT